MENETDLYPVFLKVKGRDCLVVGGGRVAGRKARELESRGADVTVLAETVNAEIRELEKTGRATVRLEPFAPGAAKGRFLVFAATDSRATNAEVAEDARGSGVLCCIADDPEASDFFSGAAVVRGSLQIAVSTGGASPATARKIKRELEEKYGLEYGAAMDLLQTLRSEVLRLKLGPEARARMLEDLAGLTLPEWVKESGPAGAEEKARAALRLERAV